MCMIKSWKSLPKAISPNHLFRWAWVKYISHGSHQKRKLSSWRNIQGARKLPIHQSLVAHKLQCKFLCYWQLNAYRFKRFGEFGQHLLHELYCTSFDSYSLASGLLPVWPPHLPVSGWAWEMFSLVRNFVFACNWHKIVVYSSIQGTKLHWLCTDCYI